MSHGRTYKSRCIVLRKTKLGEKDLIVSLLAESGELLRAVAKGARKPGGSLTAKLELFSVVDAMLAQGRNLDVVVEARFAADAPATTFGLEQGACAAAIAELVATVAQTGLEQPRLFDMTRAALDSLADASPQDALAITAAALLKLVSTAGFRPSLDLCVECGEPLNTENAPMQAFSFEDGGLVCSTCAPSANCILIETPTILWSRTLLYARFADIPAYNLDPSATFSILDLTRRWIRAHTNRDLRSLDFLFTSALF